MTLILDNDAVQALLTMDVCMEALEYAQAELGNDRAAMGPIQRVIAPLAMTPGYRPDGDERFYAYSAMAAVLPGWDVAAARQDSDLLRYTATASGVRLERYSGAPEGRFAGFVLLYRASTGELLAVIADGYLQKTRVGGLAGVAAKYLARADASVLAVIGSGWQASAQVEAHCRARPIREVRVYSPTRARREAFAAEVGRKVAARVVAVDDAEEAVRGAAIVATATNSIEPVLRAAWLEPGMFLTSVKELEFEREVYDACDVLVANRRGPMWSRHVAGGVGLIPEHGAEIWYHWEEQQRAAVRLLGEIVAGRTPGRTADDQIVAFMNQGEGLQFAAVGRRLYDLARERGLGVEAPLPWFHQDKQYIP